MTYQSYVNGTPAVELPLFRRDYLVNTFISNITDYDNLLESFQLVVHPFFESGMTVGEIAESNPQYPATVQGIQLGVLSDANNLLDKATFFFWAPFDPEPIFASDTSDWEQILSPTRVIKTAIALTFAGRGEDEGSLFMVACGVGETRDW
eukprot:TRINITY_DN5564_c0_g1_i32.p1 TRINITY_DN5564_c0_g1~~TRINITY_DN5564_c0_g1_i32.p1  ORF type:complete len:162 (-),score=24.07 TRINITY_DN5564_c0_g1_i32:901-1350(-)